MCCIQTRSILNRNGITALFEAFVVTVICLSGFVTNANAQAFVPANQIQPQPQELLKYQQQIRGLIQHELNLIAKLVKPNEQQAQALANLAESQWEVSSLREVTRRVQHHVHGSIDFDGLVERSVGVWCKDVLSEEQNAVYQAELQDRQELRREALIARMLTWLQKKLSLSANQTEEVEKVLRERWKDRWYRSVEATFSNETLLPEINQKWLEDILTPSQKNALVVRSPTEKNVPLPDVFPSLPLSQRFVVGTITSQSSISPKETDASKDPAAAKEPSR